MIRWIRWGVLWMAAGWAGVAPATAQTGYEYAVPEENGDGWSTASLADVGMDPDILADLMNRLYRHPAHLVHSLLIVKDGSLVFEEYFDGRDVDLFDPDLLGGDTLNLVARHFDRDVLHHCASVTKSVTSLLVGIAVDQGTVPSIEAPLFSFFPEYARLRSREKDRITLHDALAMASGLRYDEESRPIADARNDAHRLFFSDEPIAFTLGRDLMDDPGYAYHYNTGTTVLLGEIIRRSTGMSVDSFAEEHLFGPLGITRYRWAPLQGDPAILHAGGGLYLRPRDMAKIGQLMLRNGVWDGHRVVSSGWVRSSTTPQVRISAGGNFRSYGFQWKIGRFGAHDAYWAAGWGGQYIVVIPDLDLVFVQTAGRYSGEDVAPLYDEIIEAYVLPAAAGT
jgi:CubicO group peptidase (beta-lactamase class C family)